MTYGNQTLAAIYWASLCTRYYWVFFKLSNLNSKHFYKMLLILSCICVKSLVAKWKLDP